jgi:hypothetical protein
MTAVCSDFALASGASTAGFGTTVPGRSPALQATTPAKVMSKSTADRRARKVDMVNSLKMIGALGFDFNFD